jgi:hypothetical protein
MIEVRIPREIKKFKEKIYFNLTLRQLICVGTGMAIGIPFYYFNPLQLNETIIAYILIFIVTTLGAIGWIEYNDMKLEKLIKTLWKFNSTKQLRLYQTYTFHEFAQKQRRIKK